MDEHSRQSLQQQEDDFDALSSRLRVRAHDFRQAQQNARLLAENSYSSAGNDTTTS